MQLSTDKKEILLKLIKWLNRPSSTHISVGGYAGTGKTTLIAILRKLINRQQPKLKIAFVCFTGKATQVLTNYLRTVNSLYPQDSISTIHSLIYTPSINQAGVIYGWTKKEQLECNLIIVDEASMVSQDIWQDLLSFQIPILVFGDHGQLPPIVGRFSLMSQPNYKLETIHRQLQDNPIIKLSIMARETGHIPVGSYSHQVKKMAHDDFDTQEIVSELLADSSKNTLVLCGYNSTRVKLNQEIRQLLGFLSPEPQEGDRVICLRNNHTTQLYNGMLGTILNIQPAHNNWHKAEIKLDDRNDLYTGQIMATQFNSTAPLNFSKERTKTLPGDLFDFGYALTVHKAQGSQAKRVLLFEQRFPKMEEDEWRKWLYTAVTRAEEELYIVG